MDVSGALGGGARKASMAGCMLGSSAGAAGRRLVPEFEFSLSAAKVKVLKSFEDSLPAAFVRFYNGPLFDKLLQGTVLYFCALFQHDILSHCSERGRGGQSEACTSQLQAARLKEVAEELTNRRGDLSQPYCEIILKHSSYKNQQQDKHFFEALYATLCAVLHEAFDRLNRQAVLEQELGRLFRGKHFNMAAREHGPQRSVDSMTVMQMWEVKSKADSRALHARLISSLYEKAPTLSVQVAAVSNTPLVSQAVTSPLVARSLLADPEERKAVLQGSCIRQPQRAGSSYLGGAGAVRGATGPGTDPGSPGPVLLNSGSMVQTSPTSPTAAAASSPNGRASSIKPFQSVIGLLPEATGVQHDEHYLYLCLLRRLVLFGPQLGLPTGPPVPQPPAGRFAMLSLTGAAATSGQLSHVNSNALRP